MYKKFRRLIATRKISTKVLLLTQDFSQLTLTSSLTQELIIVFTWNQSGEAKQVYHHFVAPLKKGWTNDITFVIGVWETLEREGKFDRFKKVIVWSDGGRKHFKQRFNLRWMHLKCKEWAAAGRTLEYHFFGSNHGANACDTAASQGKRRVKQKANEDRRRITTIPQVCFYFWYLIHLMAIYEFCTNLSVYCLLKFYGTLVNCLLYFSIMLICWCTLYALECLNTLRFHDADVAQRRTNVA